VKSNSFANGERFRLRSAKIGIFADFSLFSTFLIRQPLAGNLKQGAIAQRISSFFLMLDAENPRNPGNSRRS
jgi:hypothetical protein